MSVINKINELKSVKESFKKVIERYDVDLTNVEFRDYDVHISRITGSPLPSIDTKTSFIGATIPLTYYNQENDRERIYHYRSEHNITITGLDNRAVITGNNSEHVIVSFNVSSTNHSLKEFEIILSNGETFKGLHAHYGKFVPSDKILGFAYAYIPLPGVALNIYEYSVPESQTEYMFIESSVLPLMEGTDYFWEGLATGLGSFSYQILNVLIGRYNGPLGDYFLRYAYSFNQPLDMHGITSIGTNFLQRAYLFNQPLELSNVTSIGMMFLAEAYSFNQPLDISNIKNIEYGFLLGCESFNQPLDISHLTSIGDSFLNGASSFNRPLDLSNVTSIGDYFLTYNISFNQPLELSNVTSIGDYFLSGASSFNRPLDLSNVTTIGDSFLSGASSFNRPLDLSNVTSIGDSFLRGVSLFNQPINLYGTITIGNYFLYEATTFNQPLDLSTVETIGDYFLAGGFLFNQPLEVTNKTQSIGRWFMNNCFSLSTIIWNSNKYPSDYESGSLSQSSDSKTQVYRGRGIRVLGTYRSGLMSALTNNPFYSNRKLVDGGPWNEN